MFTHRTFILFAFCLKLLLIQSEASAQQYFPNETETLPSPTRIVRITNDSELNSAISDAQPGDQILMANGNYDGIKLIELKGTASAPIVFVAENPRQAIISGSTGDGRNARLSDCAHLAFHGIRFTGASHWSFTMGPAYTSDTNNKGCHNIRIINCEVDNAGQELMKINGNSSNIEVIGSSFHHTGMSGSGKPYAEGIYIGDGNSGSDRSHDILIQGNHIYSIGNQNNWGEAIDIKAPVYNITVVDNLIEDVIVNSQGAITVLIGDANYPSGQTNPNILISRNVIHNVSHHSAGWNGAGISAGANGVTITNNLIWDTIESSITATKDASNTTGGFHVYNNTLWNGVLINKNSIGTASGNVDEVLKNNLIRGSGGSSDDMVASSSDFIGPLTDDAIADVYTGSGFQLKSNSPAVGSGAQLTLVTYDVTGALRPSSAHSLGAFETNTETGDPDPVLHTVTFLANTGGSVEGYVYQEVVAGGNLESVTAVPEAGYRFTNWSGDATSSEKTLTVSNVRSDLEIIANFDQILPPTQGEVVYAINCGGNAYQSVDGIDYDADTYYNGGLTTTRNNAINGTSDDTLYQSERYGAMTYALPLVNGDYTVTLQFAETYWSTSGSRVFDSLIEGQVVIDNLDIHQLVGQNTAYSVAIPVTLTDGVLNLSFDATVDKAKLSAIVIEAGIVEGDLPEFDTDGDGMSDSFEELYGLDPNTAADAFADTDGDGLANLLEYALNLNPAAATDASENQPQVKIITNGADQYLALEFRRLKGGSGNAADGYSINTLHYQVKCSQSLSADAWDTGSINLVEAGTPIDNGDGTETVSVRMTTPLQDSPSMFLSLTVSAI